MSSDGGVDDLALERTLYQCAAERAGTQVAALLGELVGDVAHLVDLRTRALAGLPPLDEAQSAAVDGQRMTDPEQAAASAAIKQFNLLDDADTLWALEEVIREAIYQEQLFDYPDDPASDLHAQILERRHIMLRRIQAART